MVFSSITFLFWFLPLAVAGYYVGTLPWWRRQRRAAGPDQAPAAPGWELSSAAGTWVGNMCLLSASLLFYFWGEQKRIYILFAAIALNYAAGLALGEWKPDAGPGQRRRRLAILWGAIAANLGMLIYFKYMNFVVELFAAGGIRLNVPSVVLPLGISFFIFQAMSYTIDVYRGTVPPAREIVGFACYISMFPQLVAGPIVRYCDVASQLRRRVVGSAKLAEGIRRFIIGLAKKVLIANQVALLADKAFSLGWDEVTFGAAWIGTLAYTLQIYFDFSGYSDMAIGLGKMFGFEFLENFNFPYVSRSVQEFWRRWHISLSTWYRDYLYISLGGSRGTKVQTYFNLWVVFALCGFWHGASANFLLWGIYHGLFLVGERMFRGRFAAAKAVGHGYTLLVVMFGWVLFRAESWSQTLVFWKAMVGRGAALANGGTIWLGCGRDVPIAMAAGILFSLPLRSVLRRRFPSGLLNNRGDWTGRAGESIFWALRFAALLALFLACLPLLVAETYNPFIYFRF
jgi:alginate O-acetyltransferase complex protein AlgI